MGNHNEANFLVDDTTRETMDTVEIAEFVDGDFDPALFMAAQEETAQVIAQAADAPLTYPVLPPIVSDEIVMPQESDIVVNTLPAKPFKLSPETFVAITKRALTVTNEFDAGEAMMQFERYLGLDPSLLTSEANALIHEDPNNVEKAGGDAAMYRARACLLQGIMHNMGVVEMTDDAHISIPGELPKLSLVHASQDDETVKDIAAKNPTERNQHDLKQAFMVFENHMLRSSINYENRSTYMLAVNIIKTMADNSPKLKGLAWARISEKLKHGLDYTTVREYMRLAEAVSGHELQEHTLDFYNASPSLRELEIGFLLLGKNEVSVHNTVEKTVIMARPFARDSAANTNTSAAKPKRMHLLFGSRSSKLQAN